MANVIPPGWRGNDEGQGELDGDAPEVRGRVEAPELVACRLRGPTHDGGKITEFLEDPDYESDFCRPYRSLRAAE